jgi:REP element-mobilizing transposase RayT
MARPLRIEYPGAVYHITSRGNPRADIFLTNADRQVFLDILGNTVEKYNWLCHAFCLLANHYHLIIETLDPNLSLGMRQLNGVFTQSFNRAHNRVGHVFQGRYKAILVEKESHLLELCRYVVLNPVGPKGSENFVARVGKLLGDRQEIKEIPRAQRYPGRPPLDRIFAVDRTQSKQKRNERIKKAHVTHGYTLYNGQ